MSRVRPEPGFSRVQGTHCRRGEQVIYSCDLSGRKRVSVCRDGRTVLYRFGPPNRPEIELGRSISPVTKTFRSGGSWEFRLRFPDGAYSYSVYDGETRGRRESGVFAWRSGEMLAQHQCPTHGPLQELHRDRVGDMADDTDPVYEAW